MVIMVAFTQEICAIYGNRPQFQKVTFLIFIENTVYPFLEKLFFAQFDCNCLLFENEKKNNILTLDKRPGQFTPLLEDAPPNILGAIIERKCPINQPENIRNEKEFIYGKFIWWRLIIQENSTMHHVQLIIKSCYFLNVII